MATPFLFGELARTMRNVEFNYATKENGLMNFRAALPLSEANNAIDVAGDHAFLSDNWERVKKVFSYAWLEKDFSRHFNNMCLYVMGNETIHFCLF